MKGKKRRRNAVAWSGVDGSVVSRADYQRWYVIIAALAFGFALGLRSRWRWCVIYYGRCVRTGWDMKFSLMISEIVTAFSVKIGDQRTRLGESVMRISW